MGKLKVSFSAALCSNPTEILGKKSALTATTAKNDWNLSRLNKEIMNNRSKQFFSIEKRSWLDYAKQSEKMNPFGWTDTYIDRIFLWLNSGDSIIVHWMMMELLLSSYFHFLSLHFALSARSTRFVRRRHRRKLLLMASSKVDIICEKG